MFKEIFREMFHPSKAAIISSLKKSNGLPVSQVAKEVDMSYMGVKQHCINLEKAGFLESWRVPRKEVGRPEKLYRLTEKCDSLFPTAGSDLTLALLEGVKATFGENAPEKLLLNYFNQKKELWGKEISKKKNIVDKATKLAELREKDGYFNSCVFDKEKGLNLIEYHNPLTEIHKVYPNVKRFEIDLMEELLGSKILFQEVNGDHGQPQIQFEISSLGKVA